MSQKDMVFHVGVDMSANIADVEGKFNKLKTTLTTMKLPSSSAKELNETFERASQGLEEFTTLQKKSGHTEADIRKLQQAYNGITNALDTMQRKIAGIEAIDPERLLPRGLRNQVVQLATELEKLATIEGGSGSAIWKETESAIREQKQAVSELDQEMRQLQTTREGLEHRQSNLDAAARAARDAYASLKTEQEGVQIAIEQAEQQQKDSGLKKSTVYANQIAEATRKRKQYLVEIEAAEKKMAAARKIKFNKNATPAQRTEAIEKESQQRIRAEQLKGKVALLDSDIATAQQNKTAVEEQANAIAQLKQRYSELTTEMDKQSTEAKEQESTSQQLSRQLKENATSIKNVSNQQNQATTQLELLEQQFEELKTDSSAFDTTLDSVRNSIAQLAPNVDVAGKSVEELRQILNGLVSSEIQRVQQETNRLKIDFQDAQGATDRLGTEMRENFMSSAQSMMNMNYQMDQLSSQMLYFFSLQNGWQLLRQALRKALDVVKELDAAMTEIAVVSDYTIDEIWSMRLKYSDAATEMGAKTIDLVNATKLYVQQGLTLNEALEVGIETTKMARIANLDGAEATNLMTAALRGFNMEMEEANRVNDTYSQLAAKSAADTQEIATAMSKTASIAANAGSSFENMSAFLTQIIETTREAAETAGTAMKTIIARFQELKKPMSEIGEVDGEIVDANGIEAALREANISLRDHKGEFRDFDEVILELAQKWDDLDMMTQRYIATMAAGSRQQSRFIALMSDSERLMELVGYANNAAGASNQQYEKTLESLEAKLNKLSNALNIFWTNLMNNQLIKLGIDLLTKLIEIVNKSTEAFTQSDNAVMNFIGSVFQIGMAAAAFLALQKLITGIFAKLATSFFSAGKKAGEQYTAGLNAGIATQGNAEKGLKKLLLGLTRTRGANEAIFQKKNIASLEAYNTSVRRATHATAGLTDQQERQAAMERLVAKSQSEAQTQTGLNATQLQMYVGLRDQGLSSEQAYLQVQKISNQEAKEAYITQQLETGATVKEAEANWIEYQSKEQQTEAERRSTAAKQANLATRFKLLWQILSGNVEQVKQIGITYGLISAEQADKIAKDAQTGAQWKLNAATYAFPGVWLIAIVLAIIAVVASLVVGILWLCGAFDKTETASEKLERLKEETEKAKEAAEEAANAYKDLKTKIEDLSNQKQSLNDLTRGTVEWKEQLLEANQAVLELIDTYPELLPYLQNENGELSINDIGLAEARNLAEERSSSAQANQLVTQAREIAASRDLLVEKIIKDTVKDFNWMTNKLHESEKSAAQVAGTQKQIDDAFREFDIYIDKNSQQYAVEYKNEKGSPTTGSHYGQTYYTDKHAIDFKDFDINNLDSLVEKLGEAGVAVEKFNDVLSKNAQYESQQLVYMEQAFAALLDADNAAYEYNDSVTEFFAQDTLTSAYQDSIDRATRYYLGKNYGTKGTNTSTDKLEKLFTKYGISEQYTGTAKDDIATLYAHVTGTTVEEVREKELSGEYMAQQIWIMEQNEETGKKMNTIINKMETMSVQEQKKIAGLMSLSATDLLFTEVGKKDANTFGNELQARLGYNSVEGMVEDFGMTINSFNELMENKVKNAELEAKEIKAKLNKLIQDEMAYSSYLNTLTLGQAQDLAYQLQSIDLMTDDVNLDSVLDIWTQLQEGMIEENKNTFYNLFNSINFSNLTSFFDFKNTLENLNIVVPTEQLNELYLKMKELGAIVVMTADKFNESVKNVHTVYEELKTGEQDAIYTEEEYKAITQLLPETIDSFAMNLNGEYVYIGNHMDSLRQAITENTAQLLKQNIDNLKGKIEIGSVQDTYSASTVVSLEEYIEQNNKELFNKYGEYKRYLRSGDSGSLTKTELEAFATLVHDYNFKSTSGALTSEIYFDKSGGYTDTEKAAIVQQFLKENQDKMDFSALNYGDVSWSALSAAGTEAINKFYDTIASVTDAGLSEAIAELENYEKNSRILAYQLREGIDLSLLHTSSIIQDNAENAKDFYTAILLKARTAGVPETLLSQYEAAYTENNVPLMEELEKRINEQMNRNSAYERFTNLADSLSEAVEEQESLEDVELRILKIQKALDTFGIKVDQTNVDSMLNLIRAISTGDYDAYITAMNMSAADQNAGVITNSEGDIHSRYGFIGEDDTDWLNRMYDTNQLVATEKTFTNADLGKIARVVEEGETIWAVVTQAMIDNGIAGAIMSAQSKELFTDAMSETDAWENSYDWLYNLTARLNKNLRERNKLEEEENRILESRSLSTNDLLDNLNQQFVTSMATLAAYEKLYEQRVSEDGNDGILSEIEKFNQELVTMGLKDYMWFENGTFQIDWNKIDKIKNTEQGETIEQYVSEGEFLQDELESIEDGIAEANDKLQEIRNKYIANAAELEEALIEAIITEREQAIEQLEAINSSITDANSELLDKIQEGIEDIRNQREDNKSLQNIQEMEQRLALMRTDTSGTNALDILSLEKELEEARQEYQDTQIDRAIDEMTKQNEYAADQRQLQIDLMKEQLEADKKYGEIARQVNEILSGELDANSEATIKGILSKVGDPQSLARFSQESYMTEMQKQISTGIAGILYGAKAEKDESVTFTDTAGHVVTGVADANGMIHDSSGNVYSGVYKDSTGTYRQHYTGQSYTSDEWNNLTNGIVQDLKLGTTDLVQVDDATTVKITATNVTIAGNAQSNQNQVSYAPLSNSTWEDLKTTGVSYLRGLGKTTEADTLQKSFGNLTQEQFQVAYGGQSYSDIINGIADGTVEAKDQMRVHTGIAHSLMSSFPTNLYSYQVRSVDKAMLAQMMQSSFNTLTESNLESWLPSQLLYDRTFSTPNNRAMLLKDNSGKTVSLGEANRNRDIRLLKQWFNANKHLQYKTGGLADFTGPAWLDGTKARPEYVLNAAQTQGFLALVDVLDNYNDKKSDKGSGDTYYDVHIEIDEISNDYDVEEMMDKMKRIIADDAMYRNVNAVDLGRR